MSSDFYFRKWKQTLARLQEIVTLDIHFQETKAHDKTLCDAAQRLTQILVQYMVIYNGALECLRQNLQVQKTKHIEEIIKAVVSRVLELKHELRKLEVRNYQFLSNGLAHNKLITYDAELSEIPFKAERSKNLEKAIKDAMGRAREKIELLQQEEDNKAESEKNKEQVVNWWDVDNEDNDTESNTEKEEEVSILSEESHKRQEMVNLIKSHEKLRQVTSYFLQYRQKRDKWEKELKGTSKPKARYEMRESAARLIQNVFRLYFEIKRQKLEQRKRDEILGIIQTPKKCLKEEQAKDEKIKIMRLELKKKYDQDWKCSCKLMKEDYIKRRIDYIREDYQDFIRSWLMEWFDQIQFFLDIPHERYGGSALIVKEEIPRPLEWMEEYEKYIAEKKSNKVKTPQQIQFEMMASKREEVMFLKQEALQKKLEAKLLKKMMKNPAMHPGYHYPQSNKTIHILEAIAQYKIIWEDLDETNSVDVKEKSVVAMDFNNVCMEAKLEVIAMADENMRVELKKLKTALKADYLRNGDKIFEPMKAKRKRQKKKRKIKTILSQHIHDQLEDLAVKGFLKEYPTIKLQDFLGDPNFAGEEIRCNFDSTRPFNSECRDLWWERCLEMTHGFHKILLVGPKGNGKTTLVHALASVNDAMLFELDLSLLRKDLIAAPYLQMVTNSVAACAKAVQPSVIHIKHVQRLFYNKIPAAEADYNLNIVNRFWIKKLFKRIHKTDKITLIGTCLDPWVTKSKKLLKQFHTMMLLPNTTYSAVMQLLNLWVKEHTVIPADFDVHTLAYVLRGYSYGYLKKALHDFMSPERIVKIAAYGLFPKEVYDFIIEDQSEDKIDYEKYQKWYTEKTPWGIKEQKHIEEQRNFKRLVEKLVEKSKMKRRLVSSSSTLREIIKE